MSGPDIAGKAVQPGTLIYRRADVRAWLFKLNRRYLDAMRAAEAADNQEWRFNAVQKLRLISEMREMIDTDCPVFACPDVAHPAHLLQETDA